MNVVVVRTVSEIRARRAAFALLVVASAVVTAALITGGTGARRTWTVMDRFLAYSHPVHAYVGGVTAAELRRVPQVADLDLTATVPLVAADKPVTGGADPQELLPVVSFGGGEPTRMERGIVLDGAFPDPADPAGLVVDRAVATAWALKPGSAFRVRTFSASQLEAARDWMYQGKPMPPPNGPELVLRVAAVQRQPLELSPAAATRDVRVMGVHVLYLTRGFAEKYGKTIATGPPSFDVHLRRGRADVPAFQRAVAALPQREGFFAVPGSAGEDTAAKITRALQFQSVAVLALGLATGFGGLLLVGQLIGRESTLYRPEHQTLHALGVTHRQLAAVGALRVGIAATGGVVLGVPLAVLASSLFPVGLARTAEVSPGVWVDLPILLACAVGVVVLVTLRGLASAVVSVRSADNGQQVQRSVLSRPAFMTRLAAMGLPLTVVMGIARAVRPRRATHPRPALIVAGGVLGVVAVTAALTVGANLDRLLREPALQGWRWDVMIGYVGDADLATRAVRDLGADPTVEEVTAYDTSDGVTADGRQVPAVVVSDARGGLSGRLVTTGRQPATAAEVVLGHATARLLGTHVGAEVSLAGDRSAQRYRVVGETVLWTGLLSSAEMGTGVMLTPAGLDRLSSDAVHPRHVLVRFAPGVAAEPAFRALQQRYGSVAVRYYPAEEVQNLTRVRALPYAVAGLLGLMGLLGVGLSLVTSVRDSQSELAVLKALGLVRRQVYAVVTWQAVTHGVLALAVGVPVGVAAGRWAWTGLAWALEATAGPVGPGGALLLAVPLTLVAMVVVAAMPGLVAAMARPAPFLRTE